MIRSGWTVGRAVALALCCGSAHAQSIAFQQNPTGASINGPFANLNHNVATQRVADNFSLATPASVSSIVWWGWTYNNQLNQQGALSNISAFDVRIMAADGVSGAAGTVIYQETIPTASIVATNYAAGPLAGQTYRFEAPLASNVALGAGTTYWLAINAVVINPANSGDLFVWTEQTAVGDDDVSIDGLFTLPDDSWDLTNTGYDMTFQVLAVSDSDNDGLSDAEEAMLGSDPNHPDTDGDGLLDGTEFDLFGGGSCVNLLDPDSDNDTLSDGYEVSTLGTDPCSGDTDGDGIPDALDALPLVASTSNAQVAEALAATGDLVLTFDIGNFSGPNNNARVARRNAIANRFYAAAVFAQIGLDLPAALLVFSVELRIDGDSSPPDWMLDSADRDVLDLFVQSLMDLIV